MVLGRTWRKSCYSGPQGCVRVRLLDGERVEIGDTNNPDGLSLVVSGTAWECFLAVLKQEGSDR